MIVYFAKRGFGFTIDVYFRTWARTLGSELRVIAYEDLPRLRSLPAGAYVFSDLERLDPAETELAGQLHDQLAERVPAERLLNHPTRTMRRYDVLRTLADRGVNRFRAHRLAEGLEPPGVPVFLRHEVHHLGPLSPLLRTRWEIERAVARAVWLGHDPARLLLVEFCDTGDGDGVYRKYSALVAGDHVVPRELAFSRDWAPKDTDLLDAELIAEERAYLDANPHADRLREIARLVGVDYGRFDYALLDGAIQVWEINTNPIVMKAPEAYAPEHLDNQRVFAERAGAAFAALDPGPSGADIPIQLRAPAGASRRRLRALHERAGLAAHWWAQGRAGALVRATEAAAVPLRPLLLWDARRSLRRAAA